MMPVGRLKKRPQFLKIAAKGRKCAMPGLVLQASRRGIGEAESGPRLGLTASRKVGNAVARNRARRRLRVAAEKVLPAMAEPGYDYVLIARKTTPGRPFAALMTDLEGALKRLGLYRAGVVPMADENREPAGR
jgi:ribonuclease P protein component